MLKLAKIFSIMSKYLFESSLFLRWQIFKQYMRIYYNSYVFWFGDLNFRIREDFHLNADDIKARIAKDDLKELIQNDQLLQVRNDGRAFTQLDEMLPQFPPTFKFEEGTNNYDLK